VTWPNDADGDVLRRLESHSFDFAKKHRVDFNVDFTSWPPSARAIEILRSRFEYVEICAPRGSDAGYVLLKVTGLVSYEFVTSIQRSVTSAMKPYNGACESWGLLD